MEAGRQFVICGDSVKTKRWHDGDCRRCFISGDRRRLSSLRQVSDEMAVMLRDTSGADTGDAVLPGKSLTINKYAKEIGSRERDWIEFEGDCRR
jgi:hypothetical protein